MAQFKKGPTPDSTLQPSDKSDYDSAGSSIEGPMTEDDDAEDDTMKDVPADENAPEENESAYSSSNEESDEEAPNKERPNEELCRHIWAARDVDYFNDCAHQETEGLASLIKKALRKKTIGIYELQSVATECQKTVEALDKTITLVIVVKQDLLDTGSTSLKRWNQLQSTGLHECLLEYRDHGGLDAPTSAVMKKMVEDVSQAVSGWQARLGLTLKLARDLELAIGEL
ncbi:predicted protein [Chaetomium globosum CBS 148.51]|uniref:Uncharacterized protein n=1 Tax=Chaetomium globosum (strain ATCC 6205 / CBS 148.51 / DSM 1962 / NBRC 6347 / NRRL 1970) TaxID=306901 RepID=Q2HAV5_CHAGB|nr:uncharacterized protein CHGG_02649 [Chaetomium globosum CBS 148.51]EAQ90714.1 predicted protein [Chaetomium globosum CBS 148.51]